MRASDILNARAFNRRERCGACGEWIVTHDPAWAFPWANNPHACLGMAAPAGQGAQPPAQVPDHASGADAQRVHAGIEQHARLRRIGNHGG